MAMLKQQEKKWLVGGQPYTLSASNAPAKVYNASSTIATSANG